MTQMATAMAKARMRVGMVRMKVRKRFSISYPALIQIPANEG
jgi:hypothetical protein